MKKAAKPTVEEQQTFTINELREEIKQLQSKQEATYAIARIVSELTALRKTLTRKSCSANAALLAQVDKIIGQQLTCLEQVVVITTTAGGRG
jgi:tagatose-1,6-bisphosphate aldolase